MPQTGQVKCWLTDRGFGFIIPDGGGKDVFVHRRQLPRGVEELAAGDAVQFESEVTARGVQALRVMLAGRAPQCRAPRILSQDQFSEVLLEIFGPGELLYKTQLGNLAWENGWVQ